MADYLEKNFLKIKGLEDPLVELREERAHLRRTGKQVASKVGTQAATARRNIEAARRGRVFGKEKRTAERIRVKAAKKGVKVGPKRALNLARRKPISGLGVGRYKYSKIEWKPLRKLKVAEKVIKLGKGAGGRLLGIHSPVKAMTGITQKQEYKQKVKGLESLRGKKLRSM